MRRIVTTEPREASGVRPANGEGSGRPVLMAAIAAAAAIGLALLVALDGSPWWRVGRVVAAVAIGGVAVLAQLRPDDRARGRAAVALGLPVLAVGIGFLPFAVKGGAPLAAIAGTLSFVAGLVLTVGGTVVATRGWKAGRRLAAGGCAVVATVLVAYVVGPAVAATNVPRPEVGASPESVGLAYTSVTLRTADGVDLAGWYVPSTNRAAVVLLHGAGSTRSDVLDQAAVVARHGFGVLLVDARGHGESGGRAMDFGWHGDADVAVATAWLAHRPDVDERRIGAVGMSMGGEEAIGATATDERIRAVVAEGATARSAADEAWLSDEFGVRGLVQEQIEALQDRVTDVLTSATVPISARAAVEASDARYLLVAAGEVADEGHAAAYVRAGAPHRVATWTVPGAAHTDGLATDPAEWEARVVSFLNDALLPLSSGD